jgi:endonuclease G, mitochondrial
MFLRIIFPLSILINFWFFSFLSQIVIASGQQITSDSLKNFNKNFMPAIHPKDEIVKHGAFTLCYNEKYEQASWVAYYLTAKMSQNNGEERTNDFREDPDVKTGSATPGDYKQSGYDRGHLCPAGDMGWNEQTMSESFYMSNMSPQIPGFNRGIWKNLEGNVRDWAIKNKEIYVVTAGVLKDSLATIGDNKIAIPEYYYKIILDIHLPEYKAIGFVMPNKASKKFVFNYAVSIDSVERLTGIDFFPALPDSLEESLENHFNSKLWQK